MPATERAFFRPQKNNTRILAYETPACFYKCKFACASTEHCETRRKPPLFSSTASPLPDNHRPDSKASDGPASTVQRDGNCPRVRSAKPRISFPADRVAAGEKEVPEFFTDAPGRPGALGKQPERYKWSTQKQQSACATSWLRRYINACKPRDMDDVRHLTLKLISMAGLALAATQGKEEAVSLIQSVAVHVGENAHRSHAEIIRRH